MRVAAWCVGGLMGLISLVPPAFRPDTGLEHHAEHFVALFVLGWIFGVAYWPHCLKVVLAGLCVAGLVEGAQMLVPGRHGNLEDFIWNGAGFSVGVTMAWVAARLWRVRRAK